MPPCFHFFQPSKGGCSGMFCYSRIYYNELHHLFFTLLRLHALELEEVTPSLGVTPSSLALFFKVIHFCEHQCYITVCSNCTLIWFDSSNLENWVTLKSVLTVLYPASNLKRLLQVFTKSITHFSKCGM